MGEHLTDPTNEALSERLRKLGSAVADVSDRASETGGTSASLARQSFVSGPLAEASRWRSGWRVGAVAMAVGVTLAVGFRVTTQLGARRAAAAASITFSVGAELPGVPSAPGVVGEWVAAGVTTPREARFSDGSELQLSPGARMRVTTTRPAGADVLIEQGVVHVAVAHRDPVKGNAVPPEMSTRWAVRAGPFEVHVTGTTFDAAWDPVAERFELTMIEGRVLVTGPNLPAERAVVGGEHLVVSVRDGRMVLSTRDAVPTAATMGAPVGATELPPPVAIGKPAVADPSLVAIPGAAPRPAATGEAAPAVAKWRELAASGRYRDAFVAAEAAGFSDEVERAPAADLLMLADTARFAGNAGRAREALLAARRRFSARGQSAFLLGKIAADQQASPGDAVVWFETYLREQPSGPLAEQALGRIVDLSRRSSPAAASQAAERYLARYPEGSYAALARSLVVSPSP